MGASLRELAPVAELKVPNALSHEGEPATAEDLMAITLDVKQAEARYGEAVVYWVQGDPPGPTATFTFPTILSAVGEAELSVDEFLEELLLVLEMSTDRDAPVFLYSVRVAEPRRWSWPEDGPSLSALEPNMARRADLQVGLFQYGFLQRAAGRDRRSLLASVFRAGEMVELAIRFRDRPPRQTLVRLRANRQ